MNALRGRAAQCFERRAKQLVHGRETGKALVKRAGFAGGWLLFVTRPCRQFPDLRKLVKIAARVLSHARAIPFQRAAVAVNVGKQPC